MSNKCQICGSYDVLNQGDICELCAMGQDPYASAMQGNNGSFSHHQGAHQNSNMVYNPKKGKTRKVLLNGGGVVGNTDPYGNNIEPVQSSSVQVYSSGQSPTSQNSNHTVASSTSQYSSSNNNYNSKNSKQGLLTSGITKNICVDNQRRSALLKLCRSLFNGIPFMLDDEITLFQVYPDYTGTSLNAVGNACDQVIVYGKVNSGAIAENNDIEVYGHRDSKNNIVAEKIINKASGTIVTPYRVIPVSIIWVITIAVFIALFLFITTCGIEGIVWAVILVLCLTNLPLVFKVALGFLGIVFSLFRRFIKK